MSKKICLDAGHVGSKYNQSPVVKTYYESAMVWALHLKLKAQLEARGFQVVTTRASIDTDLGGFQVPVGQPASVSVRLSCTVPLADLIVPGWPGAWQLKAEATSALDRYRRRG